jgi:hypothetical protein
MPQTKIVDVLTSDDQVKQYTIRSIVPLRIRDMVQSLMRDGRIEEGNRVFLIEMVTEPKLTKDILQSDDCDSYEMDQLITLFGAMMAGMPIKDFMLLPEDQRAAELLDRREKRIADLKKKHT